MNHSKSKYPCICVSFYWTLIPHHRVPHCMSLTPNDSKHWQEGHSSWPTAEEGRDLWATLQGKWCLRIPSSALPVNIRNHKYVKAHNITLLWCWCIYFSLSSWCICITTLRALYFICFTVLNYTWALYQLNMTYRHFTRSKWITHGCETKIADKGVQLAMEKLLQIFLHFVSNCWQFILR